jgi:hypothetical protein
VQKVKVAADQGRSFFKPPLGGAPGTDRKAARKTRPSGGDQDPQQLTESGAGHGKKAFPWVLVGVQPGWLEAKWPLGTPVPLGGPSQKQDPLQGGGDN